MNPINDISDQDFQKKKNKRSLGGRPKIKDSEKKVIDFRCLMNQSEAKIARKRLEEWGYRKFSDFVINALVYNRIICIKKVFLDEITTISINKIGNNFNQISKKLNNNENDLNVLIPLFEELKSQLIELNQRLKS